MAFVLIGRERLPPRVILTRVLMVGPGIQPG
jgi:hypothetical protein